MRVRFDLVKALALTASRSHTVAMSVRVIASVAIAMVLASCGQALSIDPSKGPIGTRASAIELGDGTGYYFYARDVPQGTMTAQAAYNAMRGTLPPKTIPTFITPRYGLLTQNDTSPPADRMPVWGFTWEGGCTVTMNVAHPGRCVYWDFARASDGKYLRVGDQQELP
jgi:hypothetical protein